MKWIATTGYSLEGVLAQELRDLGLTVLEVQTSRVLFEGDFEAACRANLWLRTAGHVALVVGAFDAPDFDSLYDGVAALPWEAYLPADGGFPVTARCINSTLMSVPDCQRIVKKAVSQRLMRVYRLSWCQESGVVMPLECHLWKNRATLSLNISGQPLHMRGYRKLNGPASLRETLAAAMVLLSHWHEDRILLDPFCGTGTIAIEAAMIARNLAPGRKRRFDGERFAFIPASAWERARQETFDLARPNLKLEIIGSDNDPQALSMAGYHAKQAGVAQTILWKQADVAHLHHPGSYGVIITNPPYGQRLNDEKTARALYATLGQRWRSLDGFSCHVISADERFESFFGKHADKKRPLYNGPLRCRYYQYFGPRPPKQPLPTP
jgi:putative N6-adenine-specific DNA methylase